MSGPGAIASAAEVRKKGIVKGREAIDCGLRKAIELTNTKIARISWRKIDAAARSSSKDYWGVVMALPGDLRRAGMPCLHSVWA
jgi:hypothetical protein